MNIEDIKKVLLQKNFFAREVEGGLFCGFPKNLSILYDVVPITPGLPDQRKASLGMFAQPSGF
jgi:hypothetical protein